MRIEVKVPVLPESVAEATLVHWHRQVGQPVKRDENLIDIETDKVVLELPAPNAGVLLEIRKPDGATVTASEVIAVIDTDGKGDEAVAPRQVSAESAGRAQSTSRAAPAPSTQSQSTSKAPPAPSTASSSAPIGVPASSGAALPAARKMMAEQ